MFTRFSHGSKRIVLIIPVNEEKKSKEMSDNKPIIYVDSINLRVFKTGKKKERKEIFPSILKKKKKRYFPRPSSF